MAFLWNCILVLIKFICLSPFTTQCLLISTSNMVTLYVKPHFKKVNVFKTTFDLVRGILINPSGHFLDNQNSKLKEVGTKM